MRAKIALVAVLLASPVAAGDLSSCHAERLAGYVGKSVKALQAVRTQNVRYVCEACAMTMDFSPQRLTVIYARKSGRVKQMRCN
ncbi:MAG: hypothetical protein KGL46_05680 [Hyphomicrobiales bacterium]|nr:hypothetical protein [Hyphomicrobiales bacterium]